MQIKKIKSNQEVTIIDGIERYVFIFSGEYIEDSQTLYADWFAYKNDTIVQDRIFCFFGNPFFNSPKNIDVNTMKKLSYILFGI